MNALSRLFEVLHLSRGEMALRRSHRRRRARRQGSALSCETLEPKQLLAADVAVQFSDIVVDTTDPVTVALEGKFEDTAVSGTVIKFETNAPLADNDFYVELTSNTPLTNANFLSYVNSGAYDNSMIHRSVSDFVLQGGGFKYPTVAADQPGSDPVAIVTTGTVQNEPGNLNNRGTIAMAKLGGQPDSATSQFFFNLSANSFLDSDNGGYTAFGDVLGSGMTVVDTMGSALTYDAQTYYSNTALSDLPLWNINQDNIVQPQDFVQIENADVVTESALMTYGFTSSDTAKLTASLDGSGNLVLTPVGSATGSVEVTVTAASRLDNSTASDTFSVQLNSQAAPTITPIESLGSTVLGKDADGKLYAGVQAISYEGQHLTETRFAAFTPLAVEDFGSNGGKEMLFENSDGSYSLWSMTSSWAYQSNIIIGAGDTSAINTALVKFGLADPAPTLTAIEEAGNTVLNQDASGNLFAGDQPILFNGTQVTVSQFPGYTPLAVEDFGSASGGKQLVFETSAGDYFAWSLTETWGYTSGAWTRSDNPSLSTFLTSFGLAAPPTLTAIESGGSTILNRDDSGNLYAGDQPILFNGTQVTVSQFPGYTPLAVEDFGSVSGGKQLVFETSAGDYFAWSLTETWGYTSGAWTRSDNPSLSTFLTSFGLAAPPTLTAIESGGSTILNRDDSGNLYAGDQPILFNGTQVTVSQFPGYTPLAVEDFGSVSGGKQLVFETSAGDYFAWSLTETWGYTSGAWTRSDNPSLSTFLTSFGLAAPAPTFTAIESGGSTILNRDADGNLFAGDQPILFGGSQTTVTQFGGYTPVAVEDFGSASGGKQLVFETSAGDYFAWSLTETWGYTSGAWTRSNSPSLSSFLSSFGLAAPAPTFTAIESGGSTILNRDADGNLFAGDQPILFGGSQTTVTQFGGYTPVAVEDFGSSKQLAFETTNGDYFTWTLTESWGYTSGAWTRSNSPSLSSFLSSFGLAAPAPTFTAIESGGSTILNRDADGNLFAGDQPILFGGSQTTVTQFGGYTPVAVEDFGSASGGKQLVFETSAGDYFAWSLTETWGYTSGAWTRSNSPSLSSFLSSFGLAAPAPTFTAIESGGSTILNRDADGNLYAGDQPILYGGSQITVTQFGGYTPVAVEELGVENEKQIVFETTASDYFIWTMSNSWSYTSGRWVRLSDSVGHSEIQATFGISGS